MKATTDDRRVNEGKRKRRAEWKAARAEQVARYASSGLGRAPKLKRTAALKEVT